MWKAAASWCGRWRHKGTIAAGSRRNIGEEERDYVGFRYHHHFCRLGGGDRPGGILRFFPIGLWISALASGVHISIGTLVGMRVRRIQPQRLVYPLIKANKAGLDLTITKLETHFLAGGNVDRVINALIAAQRANIEMPFEKAAPLTCRPRRVPGCPDERYPQGH